MEDVRVRQTSRRAFLARATTLGAASLIGLPGECRAEPPTETTRIRLTRDPAICLAPQYLAEELLRLEGFVEVQYAKVKSASAGANALSTGEADIKMLGVFDVLPMIDNEEPVVVLSGIHPGCYELYGNEHVHEVRDLKGKNVAVSGKGANDHLFIACMLAYVGVDPHREINWVATKTYAESMRAITEGGAD